MSVQSQIDRLNAIKERIRTNLVAQGVAVPADTMLEEMATQILSVAGEDGSRGFSVLRITTAPSGYTTATGGFTPTYRVALSTVLTQSKAADVMVGDTVIYSYYTYPVGYVDSSYVYLGARVSIRGSSGSAASVTADNIQSALGYTPANEAALANKSDVYNSWEGIEYEEVTGVIMKTTRYLHTYASGKYLEVVIDKYKQLKVTGYQWDAGSNFALCSFFNEQGAHVSSVTLTSATQYTDRVVDVPDTAFTVVVNGKVGSPMYLTGMKVYDCETLGEEKANRIARWVTPNIEVKDKTIISANGKSEQTQNDGELGIADVSKYQKVIVTGWQYDLSYGFDLCCFYDASGNLISSHQGTTSAKKATLSLDVPSNAVTIKVTGQRYESHVSIQGYQVFDVEDLYESLKPSGKKLITLGDSITALGIGSTGWVKYFLEKTGCELIANVAVNGATLMDKSGTTYDGNPVFNGSDNNVNNVLGNQVQKIINNNYSAPDIIIIAIGTNDGISITKDQIKAAYYDSSNNLVSLDSIDRKTSAGAYRWCLEKLHAKYPNALIFWCTPIMGYQKTRSAENAMAYAESLRIATEYTGQMMIDTIRCGINGVNELSNANGQYLVDGLHPNANGAKKIGYYNAAKVIPFLGNSFTLS